MSGYRTVKSKTVFRGQVITVKVDQVETPVGDIIEREHIEHGGAVGVVAITDEQDVLLVRQYRHPTGDDLLEIPAGKIDPGETFAECAARELGEETGYLPASLCSLASFYTSPGYSNEMFHLFLSESLVPRPELMNEDEIDLVVKVPLKEFIAMARQGRLKDGKTVAAAGLASLWLEDDPNEGSGNP